MSLPMSKFSLFTNGMESLDITLPTDTKEWKLKELCEQHLYHCLYPASKGDELMAAFPTDWVKICAVCCERIEIGELNQTHTARRIYYGPHRWNTHRTYRHLSCKEESS